MRHAFVLTGHWTTGPVEGDTDPVQTSLRATPNTTEDMPTDSSVQAPAEPTNQLSDTETHAAPVNEDVYFVDCFVACKTVNKVKWIGYKEITWEPAGIPDELIRDFHVRKTRRRRGKPLCVFYCASSRPIAVHLFIYICTYTPSSVFKYFATVATTLTPWAFELHSWNIA